MDVRAKAKYIRMSPRKVRLVVDVVRGMDALKAKDQLRFLQKAAVGPVLKLLNSAIANAANNFDLKENNLYIKEIKVDQGPSLKRWRPRAFGRAAPIRKRTSHISIVLGERVETASQQGKGSMKKEKPILPKPEVVADYKSVAKGEGNKKRTGYGKDAPEKIAEKPETNEESKDEPFDQARAGKHRHQENIDKKKLSTKRGFLKKMFQRKSG